MIHGIVVHTENLWLIIPVAVVLVLAWAGVRGDE